MLMWILIAITYLIIGGVVTFITYPWCNDPDDAFALGASWIITFPFALGTHLAEAKEKRRKRL